ncbi:hypothetical protein [Geobacter sp. FeAm09]|uniref:hypothetical protein n=1 Tax=Geobacter sp. FeAm09 TaxID=2597769 RepID=UPI00197B0718|nr:hypothetical protein [Geobacter sp. FeAm09]
MVTAFMTAAAAKAARGGLDGGASISAVLALKTISEKIGNNVQWIYRGEHAY